MAGNTRGQTSLRDQANQPDDTEALSKQMTQMNAQIAQMMAMMNAIRGDLGTVKGDITTVKGNLNSVTSSYLVLSKSLQCPG